MCHLFSKQSSDATQLRPSKSRFGSNKSTLAKLMRLTMETGFVTTAAALLELILGIVYNQQMYHIAV